MGEEDQHVCRDRGIVDLFLQKEMIVEAMAVQGKRIPDEFMGLFQFIDMLAMLVDEVGREREQCCTRITPQDVHRINAAKRQN